MEKRSASFKGKGNVLLFPRSANTCSESEVSVVVPDPLTTEAEGLLRVQTSRINRVIGGIEARPAIQDIGGLVRLDVGLLNNRGERFALLAGEVCKGLAGKAGELDCKGIEAFA
jgi:hypothetical protein